MARHPTMTTPDGVWSVEILTVKGRQSFRVKRLDSIPPPGSSGWTPTGQLVRTIDEVKAIMGDAFGQLQEARSKRFDGGR